MTWNHRIIRTIDTERTIDADGKAEIFRVHEVFYGENGEISSWTAEPVNPIGESHLALAMELGRMLVAIAKPTLEEKEVGGKSTLVEVGEG